MVKIEFAASSGIKEDLVTFFSTALLDFAVDFKLFKSVLLGLTFISTVTVPGLISRLTCERMLDWCILNAVAIVADGVSK
ncbi:hypothetical protein GCM10009128_22920 [Psychrosphaera haliotis]